MVKDVQLVCSANSILFCKDGNPYSGSLVSVEFSMLSDSDAAVCVGRDDKEAAW
jgi:hypothetical protein